MYPLSGFHLTINVLLAALAISNGLDVYVIGGRGDLARRYLWKGFFEVFHQNQDKEMHFYATGRTVLPESDGDNDLSPFQNILHGSINCNNNNSCQKDLSKFIRRADYLPLQNRERYKEMCSRINIGRSEVIFYFSVPPAAYQKVVKMIADYCDLKEGAKKYKFVFEKPFGTDFKSALALSDVLETHVDESQIYRVDHYLGKETVHQIMDFRRRNPEINHMINRHFVKRIEITVTEMVGCKGRASYYDKSGVIRDMLQSHLTEVLCLLTMDISEEQSKLHLLKNISTVKMTDVFLAQYQGYSDEVALETKKEASWIPTFALARINITGARWSGVPVRLSSGKMLKERSGYGRVVFKHNHAETKNALDGCDGAVPQIVFIIRSEKLKSPAILVSRSLPIAFNYVPYGWVETENFNDLAVFGARGKCFRIYIPTTQQDAYTYLIGRLYESDKEPFLAMNTLLESWRIWSSVAKEADKTQYMTLYKQGSSPEKVLLFRHGTPRCRKCLKMNIFLKRCDET